VQTTRLAASFEPLNSSLPLSMPELHIRKATYDPAVLVREYDSYWTSKLFIRWVVNLRVFSPAHF